MNRCSILITSAERSLTRVAPHYASWRLYLFAFRETFRPPNIISLPDVSGSFLSHSKCVRTHFTQQGWKLIARGFKTLYGFVQGDVFLIFLVFIPRLSHNWVQFDAFHLSDLKMYPMVGINKLSLIMKFTGIRTSKQWIKVVSSSEAFVRAYFQYLCLILHCLKKWVWKWCFNKINSRDCIKKEVCLSWAVNNSKRYLGDVQGNFSEKLCWKLCESESR